MSAEGTNKNDKSTNQGILQTEQILIQFPFESSESGRRGYERDRWCDAREIGGEARETQRVSGDEAVGRPCVRVDGMGAHDKRGCHTKDLA
jgi:hypothetical protein